MAGYTDAFDFEPQPEPKRLFQVYLDCPIKDGEGNPWYDAPGSENPFSLDKESARDFNVKILDAVTFRFPATFDWRAKNTMIEAKVAHMRQDFLVCLVIQSRQKNYFLHKLSWAYEGQWKASWTEPNLQSGHFRIYNDGEIRNHQQPENLKLEGPGANEATKAKWLAPGISYSPWIQGRAIFTGATIK